MPRKIAAPVIHHFSSLEDPRIERHKKHELIEIIVISICAILCGIDSFEGIEEFGLIKKKWLKRFLSLKHGIPSHDTINRVFSKINPKKFQECFVNWMQEVSKLTKGEVIPIDGKTLRRSFDTAASKSPIHIVSAWASENGVVMGQVKVDDKSNEITAIPKLLDALDIAGCLITIDAIGCQREICKQILQKKADYCIVVKKNQNKLYEDIATFFEEFAPTDKKHDAYSYSKESTKGHGRKEFRQYFITADVDWLQEEHNWPGLKAIGLVKSTRIINDKASYEERFFITSFGADAKKFHNAVKKHWSIENNLHWSLDVNFSEDQCRARKDHAAENFSILRRITFNLLKKIPDKGSIPKKRIRCAFSEDYLLKALISQGF